jgi:predicted nuclease of predicted toxin-antitoxin system
MLDFNYLVDLNLARNFSFFNKAEFSFVIDIDPRMTDSEIWNLAIETNKVILTKDSDFFNRSITSMRKAKVVHFEIGNMNLKELHEYFRKNWDNIYQLLNEFDLIVADAEKIKGIL